MGQSVDGTGFGGFAPPSLSIGLGFAWPLLMSMIFLFKFWIFGLVR